MEPLLYLTHRIPFPPNKGDKLRSYHLLKHLASKYRVFLGTFVDDDADWHHVEAVRALCEDTWFGRIHPRLAPLRGLTGLLTGEPITPRALPRRPPAAWVDGVLERGAASRKQWCSRPPMAQYVLRHERLRRVVDFVDVDSDKWRQYAAARRWPVSWAYRPRSARPARVRASRRAAGRRELLRHREGGSAFRAARARLQGPHLCVRATASTATSSRRNTLLSSPYPVGVKPVVFTGAMDYWPNIDAVCWFAREALPRIRGAGTGGALLHRRHEPAASVRTARRKIRPWTVTGRVDDVRPYVRHAAVAVAPLRVARGIQNKVLEAMAMAKPVVVSASSAAALSARPGVEIEVAETPEGFAAKTLALLASARADDMGRAARRRVLADYDWGANLKRFDEALGGDEPGTGGPHQDAPAARLHRSPRHSGV